MSITMQCHRCGTTLTVPDEKAGKTGRCPTCGGMVKVPVPEKSKRAPPLAPPHAPTLKIILGIGVPLILVAAVCFVLRGGPAGKPNGADDTSETGPVGEAAVQLADETYRVRQLEASLREYSRQLALERRYRARDVLTKGRNYEAISDYEAELRRSVLDEQEKASKAAERAGTPMEDWRLDVPLTSAERGELARFSEELQKQTQDIGRKMARLNMTALTFTDPLGRTLLNIEDARAKIDARKAELRARQGAGK